MSYKITYILIKKMGGEDHDLC